MSSQNQILEPMQRNVPPPSTSSQHSRRHSFSLGVLSTIWGSNASTSPYDASDDDSVTQSRPATFRQLNRGALRSRLRHRATKSTSTNTSVSSQPVVVRTYSGSRSRHSSQARSSVPPTMRSDIKLPAIDSFSFDGILQAVESEINGPIDGIAEIYARSKLSLADEYSAHLPPQGEIMAYSRMRYIGPLTAVPEASSSSERLAAESRASSENGIRRASAYSSLRSIISGSKSKRPDVRQVMGSPNHIEETRGGDNRHKISHWTVTHGQRPSITLALNPTASNQLSITIPSPTEDIFTAPTPVLTPHATASELSSRSRSKSFGSLTSWLPWNRPQEPPPISVLDGSSYAESKLKDLLRSSSLGHDKHVVEFA